MVMNIHKMVLTMVGCEGLPKCAELMYVLRASHYAVDTCVFQGLQVIRMHMPAKAHLYFSRSEELRITYTVAQNT